MKSGDAVTYKNKDGILLKFVGGYGKSGRYISGKYAKVKFYKNKTISKVLTKNLKLVKYKLTSKLTKIENYKR